MCQWLEPKKSDGSQINWNSNSNQWHKQRERERRERYWNRIDLKKNVKISDFHMDKIDMLPPQLLSPIIVFVVTGSVAVLCYRNKQMESDRKIMIIDADVWVYLSLYAMFSCWLSREMNVAVVVSLLIVYDDSILRIENVKFIYFNVKHTKRREREKCKMNKSKNDEHIFIAHWNLNLVYYTHTYSRNATKMLMFVFFVTFSHSAMNKLIYLLKEFSISD